MITPVTTSGWPVIPPAVYDRHHAAAVRMLDDVHTAGLPRARITRQLAAFLREGAAYAEARIFLGELLLEWEDAEAARAKWLASKYPKAAE